MINIFFVLITLFFAHATFGQESLIKVINPKEVSTEVVKYQGIPKELEGLNWNRWTSKNFVVCSLNDPQAQYLHKHLELVKGWIFTRWGLYDIDFSAQCKLICVDDKDTFKKLFNLEKTRVEIRRDSNDRITETVIFLLIDGPPSETIPLPLTQVCLAEFSQKFNCEFKPWANKGIGSINGTLSQIRNNIKENKKTFDVNYILNLNNEEYNKLSEIDKSSFDICSLYFCLFLRKEFGQDKFLIFLQKSSQDDPEEAVKKVLGFKDFEQINSSFSRYLNDLKTQVLANKTPDSYLQVNEKKP